MSYATSCVILSLVLAEVQAPEAPVPVVTPPVVAVDMAEFDAAVQAGHALYFAGDYLAAARTWRAVARTLPMTPDQRGNVVAVHGYMADGYDKAVLQAEDASVVREALAALDEHAVQFAAAYPNVPLTARVEEVRGRLRGRLLALEAVDESTTPESVFVTHRDVRPEVRPWRGLAAGGGAVLAGGAAMAVVFAVGLVRTKQFEDGLQSAALTCQINNAAAPCGGYYDDYRMANTMQLTGMILGPALLGAGAAMMFVAIKRKRTAEQSATPLVGRGFVGLGFSRRF